MSRKLMLIAAAATIIGLSPAAAQDFTLDPTFGAVTLNAGFTPDPTTVDLVAGGGIDAGNLGNGCIGMIANAPDYRLNYTAGGYSLFIAAIASEDTTLVINAPDGSWYCDDDGAGYPNPMVVFDSPMSGQYDIWVGTYGTGNPSATLHISELGGPDAAGGMGNGGMGGGGMGGGMGGMPDYTLDPTFGDVTLAGGFTPDPYTVALVAGGDIDAGAAGLGDSCYGYIAEAPDFRLYYTPGGYPLFISALSDTDTTLIINAPDGQWYCDDDGAGYPNPMVTFDNPMAGQYDIWIGTYGGGTADATLQISELGGSGGTTVGGGGTPDYTLTPTFGEVNLAARFSPQPYTVDVVGGSGIEAGDAGLGGGCYGVIAEAPDFRIQYTPGNAALIFRVMSQDDTTLVINAPDGQWYCDDDGAGYPNPEVRFDSPMEGQYDIWIGAYGGGNPNATLQILEQGGAGGK